MILTVSFLNAMSHLGAQILSFDDLHVCKQYLTNRGVILVGIEIMEVMHNKYLIN